MGNHWMAIHESMVQTISTLKASQQLKKFSMTHQVFRRFDCPGSIIAFLNNKTGDLDKKDRIYRILVEQVQGDSEWHELATALIWCGLWPGLDAIYRNRLQDFIGRSDELVTEISYLFTSMINRIELSGVNRLASTLILNMKRDLREGLKRRWIQNALQADLPEDDKLSAPNSKKASCEPSDLGLLPGMTIEEQIEAIRDWLAPRVGDENVDLVIGAAIYGESLKGMGEQLGISYEAARKRFQRMIKNLKECMKIS